MTDPELKSCPFCPDSKSAPGSSYFGGYWYVVCSGCGTEGPHAKTQKKSFQLWNARRGETG